MGIPPIHMVMAGDGLWACFTRIVFNQFESYEIKWDSIQQLPQRQQEESSKSKNGGAEAPVHNLNAASGIDKYWTIRRWIARLDM